MKNALALAAPVLAIAFFASTSAASIAAVSGDGLPHRQAVWSGQKLVTKNGTITAAGSTLTVATAAGKSTTIDRADPAFANPTMPVADPMASCAKLEQFIKLYPLTDITWRRAVVAYMNRCL